MAELFQNFATTETTAAFTAVSSTLYVQDASVFSVLPIGTSPDENAPILRVALEGPDPSGTGALREIVAFDFRMGNGAGLGGAQASWGRRGMEGTTAQAWPIGTKVYATLTAAQCAPLSNCFIDVSKSGSNYVFTRADGSTVTV